MDSPLKSSRQRRGLPSISVLDETVDDLDITMTPRQLQLAGFGGEEVDLAERLNKLGKADTFLIQSNPQYQFINEIDDGLVLKETEGESINQYYHFGKELGEGMYGIVMIGTRNCQAYNLSKNS